MSALRSQLAVAIGSALAGSGVAAQELPSISADMLGKSATACIMIGDDGYVVGALLVQSSGDGVVDQEMLAYARQLRWDAAKPGATDRNRWIPMGLAFGDATPRKAPASCGPTA